jgi:hypothetical protein
MVDEVSTDVRVVLDHCDAVFPKFIAGSDSGEF